MASRKRRTREFFAPLPQHLGAILRGYRHELGLSQSEVARRGGLLQKSVSKIENDPGTTTVETLYRVLSVLNAELVLRDRDANATSGLDW